MASAFDLSNKVAIITGASSGIGQATAILFAQRGASVVLCGRNQERLDAAVDLCKKSSGDQAGQFIGVNGDITDSGVRKSIVDKTVQTFGRLDILVANAGVSLPKSDIYQATEEVFDINFNLHVKSVFFLIQAALPHLEKSRGNIVSVSSTLSTYVFPKTAIYPMSKAAVDHMTRCLALDLGPKGIRVNAVNPSYIRTRICRNIVEDFEKLAKLVEEKENPKHPLNGVCITLEDVANAIAFLASDAARSVTGQCHVVDGGRMFMGVY